MKILFLNSYLSFPRYTKRIKAINNLGVKTTVLGYDRDHIQRGENPSGTVLLGKIQNGKHLQRILVCLNALLIVRRECKKVDICYCFGLDIYLSDLSGR